MAPLLSVIAYFEKNIGTHAQTDKPSRKCLSIWTAGIPSYAYCRATTQNRRGFQYIIAIVDQFPEMVLAVSLMRTRSVIFVQSLYQTLGFHL